MAAPIGVAANAISGRTLRTLFQLPVKLKKPCELTGVSLNNLQLRLRHCRYLIIDEKSMISPRMLETIDSRCRQVFPTTKDQNFGGLNIILFGDFAQLPPVLDKPLFTDVELSNLHEVRGRTLYKAFDKTVELDQVIRQQGDEEAEFREILNALRQHRLTQVQWRTLVSCSRSELPYNEVQEFDDALQIFPTRDAVDEFNHRKLRDIKMPILRIFATNVGHDAHRATSAEAGNLHQALTFRLNLV
jgi:hypothetical protein